jgi:hypothetical protein
MSTRERVQELVGYVQAGRIPEAIERFYADGATLGSHVEQVTELQEEPVLDAAHA